MAEFLRHRARLTWLAGVFAIVSACGASPPTPVAVDAADVVADVKAQFAVAAGQDVAGADAEVAETKPDVAVADAAPDVAAPDAAPEVADAAMTDAAVADTPPDVAAEVPDVAPDTSPDVLDIAPDLPPDLPPDVAPDLPPADSGPDAAVAPVACPSGQISANGTCAPSSAAVHAGDADSIATNTVSLYLLPPNNLLVNGGAEDGDFTGWTVTNGGDAWVTGSGDAPFGSRWFRGSYDWGYLAQTVDLLAAGISETDLDSGIPLHLGVFGVGWGFGDASGKPDTISLSASFRDATGTELGTWTSPNVGLEVGAWGSAAVDSTTYPVGTRQVAVTIGSIDGEFWAGNYAATIDGGNASVGALEVRVSNEDGVWSAWQAFASVVTGWSLTPGSGLKTVQVEFRDGNGVSLGVVTDTVTVQ